MEYLFYRKNNIVTQECGVSRCCSSNDNGMQTTCVQAHAYLGTYIIAHNLLSIGFISDNYTKVINSLIQKYYTGTTIFTVKQQVHINTVVLHFAWNVA